MGSTTVVTVYCDFHAARDETVNGAEPYDFALRTPGGRFRFVSVDLCETCAKELTGVFDQVTDAGRDFDGTRPAEADDADRTCPKCGKVLKNPGSMRAHVRSQHGTTVSALTGTKGEFVCPDCGDSFTKPQGLSAHRRIRHPKP